MTLATKYQNHPAFLEVSASASQALCEIAEAFGVQGILEKDYETAAGNVVDDITRLLLILMDARKVAA